MARARPAVFADRDGTLNREVGYMRSVAAFRLMPRTADALRALRDAGFAVVVVSNQSGIARGLFGFGTVSDVHAELRRRLARSGAALDGIYFCPHHPEAGTPPLRCRCRCRKPAPGMVHRAARDLGLDVARSYVVGDHRRDLELAAAVGVPGVLVLTGHGRATRRELDGRVAVAHVAANFRAAAEWIIDDAVRRKRGSARPTRRRTRGR